MDRRISVAKMNAPLAVPPDVALVRKRPKKKCTKIEPKLNISLQLRQFQLMEGILNDFALGMYYWLSAPPTGTKILAALIARIQRAQGLQKE